jgi:hypothetical protein
MKIPGPWKKSGTEWVRILNADGVNNEKQTYFFTFKLS